MKLPIELKHIKRKHALKSVNLRECKNDDQASKSLITVGYAWVNLEDVHDFVSVPCHKSDLHL